MIRSPFVRAALIAAMVTAAASCSGGSGDLTNPCGINNPCSPGGGNGGGQTGSVVSIGFGTLPTTVYVEHTFPLGATALDANGAAVPGVAITYTTSDASIAEVDVSGAVHAKKPGTVTITATGGGKTGTVTVIVTVWSLSRVDAGGDFTCGFTPDGGGYCWGRGRHLGVQTDSTCFDEASNKEPCALLPLHIAPSLTFNAVSAGGMHSCAITPAKQAYCWGNNDVGQLGNGLAGTGGEPTRVIGGLAFATISAGAGHTCGIIPSGTTYCWGEDGAGQLGNLRRVRSSTPIPIDGAYTFASVSAGGGHTCALQADGTAYCWGSNSSGQLGNGLVAQSDTAVVAAAGLKFRQITAGGNFTCARALTGPLYCWGANGDGQLGIGAPSAGGPTPVLVAGGLTFADVDAGSSTACALTADGTAYCWGWNFWGQIGDNSVTSRFVPTAVSGGLKFTALATADRHSCGVAADGTYCWGSDVFGPLGDQLQAIFRPTPVRVAAPRQP